MITKTLDKKYLKTLNDINQVARKYYKNYLVYNNKIFWYKLADIKKLTIFKNSFIYCMLIDEIFNCYYIIGDNMSAAIRNGYNVVTATDDNLFMGIQGIEPMHVGIKVSKEECVDKFTKISENTELIFKEIYGTYTFSDTIIERLMSYEMIYENIGFNKNKEPIHMVLTVQLVPAIKKLRKAFLVVGDPIMVNTNRLYQVLVKVGDTDFGVVSKHTII